VAFAFLKAPQKVAIGICKRGVGGRGQCPRAHSPLFCPRRAAFPTAFGMIEAERAVVEFERSQHAARTVHLSGVQLE
jgi:hypothetical protein